MTLRTLNYGNYGIFLIMGHAGFCPSTVWGALVVGTGFGENDSVQLYRDLGSIVQHDYIGTVREHCF